MLAVVCYLWNDGSRPYFPEHVNILARGYRRNLSIPHRFICISDETKGFSDEVDVLPLPDEARFAARLKTPHGDKYPSSYRRLWTFSKEAEALGDLILMTDIDCIVTGSVDPLIDEMGDSDFIGWRPPTSWNGVRRVAGGNWILRAGSHTEVWDRFSAKRISEYLAAGQRGSDQAWISHCLASTCKTWKKGHGIYEAQWMRPNKFRLLPDGARIVHFNGKKKPWDMLHIDWIQEHWT